MDSSTPRDVGGTSDVGGASATTLAGPTYLPLSCDSDSDEPAGVSGWTP